MRDDAVACGFARQIEEVARLPALCRRLAALLTLLACAVPGPARAWVYPEHREIALLAVEGLDPMRKAQFDDLWRAAVGTSQRLCQQPADTKQGVTPECIDWAALPAIAGDHSCSSQQMLHTVLDSRWILSVADVAAQLKLDLARIDVLPLAEQAPRSKDLIGDLQRRMATEPARAARDNALRTADTRMQSADPDYATRAGSNNAHFLLSRPRTDTTALEYMELALRTGSEVSALGVYGRYHLSALQKATRLANETLSADQRSALARAMLFDEAFALHFLEDIYAAGHVAGTWGDASQRKGTHDYYNEAGLEVYLWQGGPESVVLMGDAHMRPDDAERAAVAVRKSLERLLDVAAAKPGAPSLPHTPTARPAPDAFDVCKNNTLPTLPDALRPTPEVYALADEVVKATPMPRLGPGLGAMPRFRSEVGHFFGLAGSIDASYLSGGLSASQEDGWIGGVEFAARAGLGLEGVIGDSGDGLVFASLGVRATSPSTSSIEGATAPLSGGITAAVPAQLGISARLRMPFYLIPGDLALLSPLYFTAPESYSQMAVTAANGGLVPWQSGWATSIGRFQFVLGRELGVTFFGLIDTEQVLAPSATPGGQLRLVNFKSTYFDVPILEYRPYRSFASNQSSTVLVQLFAGANVPHGESIASPAGAPSVDLSTVWSVGLRMMFDWRYYP